MDTDPGSRGVSTLATQEANREQCFDSETPEELEYRPRSEKPVEVSASRQGLPSRGKRASQLIELAGDDGLHQRVPSSKRYASRRRARSAEQASQEREARRARRRGSMQQRRALELRH